MWFPVHNVDVLLRTKCVNNDRICREVDVIGMEVIEHYLSTLQNVDAQLETAEILEDYLAEYVESERSILGVEVICDARNNSRKDCEDGKVHLTIKYRQQNCLNITELAYEIKL